MDEAHHASARSYRRILSHLEPSPLILGVTATPQRSDGSLLGEVWEQIVYQRGIAEMIRAGYLADIRGIRVGLESVDLDNVAQSGGDYQADALGAALEQAFQDASSAHLDAPQARFRVFRRVFSEWQSVRRGAYRSAPCSTSILPSSISRAFARSW